MALPTTSCSTIWVDVEDFFAYFDFNPRPSGIQRLAFEIKREMQRRLGDTGRLRFVRHADSVLREVAWAEVAAVFERPPPIVVPPPTRVRRRPSRRRATQAIIARLPAQVREPLFRAAVLQRHVGENVGELLGALRPPRAEPRPVPPVAAAEAGRLGEPGDTYLVLGAPWAVPGFPAVLQALKERSGLHVALLLYDLIPVRHPEWCSLRAVTEFNTWLDATLPLCDRLMAISRHTAIDVQDYARERGLALAGPVQPIPIGTGFSAGTVGVRPEGLPPAGSYVLFVSTLEARKNHALLVRLWRRLAGELRAGVRRSLPTLVFAGRVGWMVADMLQQLDNMAWLGGRIRLIRDPSDTELRALYEGCLFTILPSLFEGWGLPLTESLAHGKPCLAADVTALPEAGGSLCRYFDPENAGSAHRAVAALIDDPAAIAMWQEQVRREFRPTPWAETADAVLAQCATVA